MLLTMPPRIPRRWTEFELDETLDDEWGQLLSGLRGLKMDESLGGRPSPVPIGFSVGAKKAWVEHFNDHWTEMDSNDDSDCLAVWAKLEAYGARLALVDHLVRVVCGEDGVQECRVGQKSVECASRLIEWFGGESLRIYDALRGRSPCPELLSWISTRDGPVSLRDVRRGCKKYHGAGGINQAEIDLLSLVNTGQLKKTEKAGKNGRRIVFFTQVLG